MNKYDITVITSTIGRMSLLKLSKTLSEQNVKVLHLIFWDNKRETNGLNPNDEHFESFKNDYYNIFHYIINHPVYLEPNARIDNHMRIMGLSMTTTDYITMIDDDCWIEPNWFKTAISNLKNSDYCYCQRYIWENEQKLLGFDNYESIGNVNKFGYHLMDMNTVVYCNNLKKFLISILLTYNNYLIDRVLAEGLLKMFKGVKIKNTYLNQISPTFLLEFHKQNIKIFN